MTAAGQRTAEVDVQDADRAIASNAVGPHWAGDVLVQCDGVVERPSTVIADVLTGSRL